MFLLIQPYTSERQRNCALKIACRDLQLRRSVMKNRHELMRILILPLLLFFTRGAYMQSARFDQQSMLLPAGSSLESGSEGQRKQLWPTQILSFTATPA